MSMSNFIAYEEVMYEVYEKLIKEKGMNSAFVAKSLGMSPTVFYDWKSGKSSPKTDKLIKIANFLDVSLDFLTTGQEDSQTYSDENAIMIAKIALNPKMLDVVKKLYALDEKKQKHVIELIDLLSE